MSARIFVPADTSAASLGAEELASALAEALPSDITMVRNGSRGAFWLEPLVEFEQGERRLAFGPVTVEDVPALVECLDNKPEEHPLCLGPTADIPWLAAQSRLSFRRAGVDDPLSITAFCDQGGFAGLEKALASTPQDIVDAVKASGLRGRGGAAFPAGIKWQTVLDTQAAQKYIVCNADEGDSGTFADRLMMESDPFQLIEGMIIAGLAVGATEGYFYLRSEYPRAWHCLQAAIGKAEAAGYLGSDIRGSGRAFHLHLRLGAGAYICGEETSLLASLEGQRGLVRAKPPLPAIEGLFGMPTVVNNVMTFAAVTTVMAEGAEVYANFGQGRSLGTLTAQLAGNIKQGGLVEIPFGATLRTLLEDFGGGSASGRPLRAVQVGGPLGAYLPEDQWETPLDYEAFAEIGAMVGHGGIVAFDDRVDMAKQARFAMAFCAEESCGKCTPCRIGSVRGVEVIDRIMDGEQVGENLVLLEDLCVTMEEGSLCAMGGLTPSPVRSALKHFPEDFPEAGG